MNEQKEKKRRFALHSLQSDLERLSGSRSISSEKKMKLEKLRPFDAAFAALFAFLPPTKGNRKLLLRNFCHSSAALFKRRTPFSRLEGPFSPPHRIPDGKRAANKLAGEILFNFESSRSCFSSRATPNSFDSPAWRRLRSLDGVPREFLLDRSIEPQALLRSRCSFVCPSARRLQQKPEELINFTTAPNTGSFRFRFSNRIDRSSRKFQGLPPALANGKRFRLFLLERKYFSTLITRSE